MASALPTLAELGGCIFAKPTSGSQGYAKTMWRGKSIALHRKAFIQAHGEIPNGMVVDHICHNVAVANGMCLSTKSTCIHRSCINIEHLRLITISENQIAGLNGFGSRTHCKKGHELTEDNIYTTPKQNFCKTCRSEAIRVSQRAYRLRKKVA
jgi:hypothetical protein